MDSPGSRRTPPAGVEPLGIDRPSGSARGCRAEARGVHGEPGPVGGLLPFGPGRLPPAPVGCFRDAALPAPGLAARFTTGTRARRSDREEHQGGGRRLRSGPRRAAAGRDRPACRRSGAEAGRIDDRRAAPAGQQAGRRRSSVRRWRPALTPPTDRGRSHRRTVGPFGGVRGRPGEGRRTGRPPAEPGPCDRPRHSGRPGSGLMKTSRLRTRQVRRRPSPQLFPAGERTKTGISRSVFVW